MNMLDEVIECFEAATKGGYAYAGIAVQIGDNPELEYIINTGKSIPNKLQYYKDTYAKDGTHKFAKEVRIVGADYADYVDELVFFEEDDQ
jgi:hypothetical protein